MKIPKSVNHLDWFYSAPNKGIMVPLYFPINFLIESVPDYIPRIPHPQCSCCLHPELLITRGFPIKISKIHVVTETELKFNLIPLLLGQALQQFENMTWKHQARSQDPQMFKTENCAQEHIEQLKIFIELLISPRHKACTCNLHLYGSIKSCTLTPLKLLGSWAMSRVGRTRELIQQR